MRRFLRLTLTLALIAGPAWPARGVILELNSGTRVAGFLVRENDREVVVRRVIEGQEVEQAYPRAEIALVLRAVDPERLATLRPEEPKAYRNYAEELAEKRDDPEARQLALRLFHIAAVLDPEGLGRGCLLGMSTLADPPEQERQYRAMAYLLDPRHDRSVLQPATARSEAPAHSGRALRQFAGALQAYRTQQTARALNLANEPGVKDLFDASPGLLSFEDFVRSCREHPECGHCGPDGRVKCQACRGSGKLAAGGLGIPGGNTCPDCHGWGTVPCPDCQGKRAGIELTEDQLLTFLRLELMAEGPSSPAAPSPGSSGSWSAALRRRSRPAPWLSLRHLTPFDPSRSVYRDGEWVEPGEDQE